ncbi:MAG: hypothetical protein ACLP7P_08960 [Rhodomicrobium sp.]
MTGFMLDMMVMMMPWMKPLLYIGLLAVVAGLALTVAKPMIACEPRLKGLLWSGRIAVGMGLFFFACEGMGAILGAAPQFNLGDATKFEFRMVPFWHAGALLLLCGLFIGNILAHARKSAAGI